MVLVSIVFSAIHMSISFLKGLLTGTDTDTLTDGVSSASFAETSKNADGTDYTIDEDDTAKFLADIVQDTEQVFTLVGEEDVDLEMDGDLDLRDGSADEYGIGTDFSDEDPNF